jgi:hypothetical protein
LENDLLDVGHSGFRVTSPDPHECLCRFNMETLWSDARIGFDCEMSLIAAAGQAGPVYPIAVS